MRLRLSNLSLKALALAVVAANPTGAFADNVTLSSADGTIDIVGEFVDFTDNLYVIRTALGNLRVSASRVTCSGDACPDLNAKPADVRVVGSETIAVGLMPLLLEGLAVDLGAANDMQTAGRGNTFATFVADNGFGDELSSFQVRAEDSRAAFQSLMAQEADIALSSRRIVPDEARALRDAGAGNMVSPEQEHIIGVDSLIVITHPDNPVEVLTMQQLADIYSGRITNWSQVGGLDAPITVMQRREGTGTRDVFMDRVFGGEDPRLLWSVLVRDSGQMAVLVNGNKNAIGYVGYAFQRGAKPTTLIDECGLTMTPDAFSARTEEYALQRRLYLYNRADISNDMASKLIDFSTSQDADFVISKAGFIGLGIDRRPQSSDDNRAKAMLSTSADAYERRISLDMIEQMEQYDRLSTTFRFRTASSNLDERGRVDMETLIDYVEALDSQARMLIVGFTDNVGQFDSNRVLSERRASEVMGELQAAGQGRLDNVEMSAVGYGEIAPSGCNQTDEGRRINRRVEIWIQ